MIALLLGMVTTSDCQQRNPDTDNMLSENLCLEELLCFVGLYMCAGSSEGTQACLVLSLAPSMFLTGPTCELTSEYRRFRVGG